MAETVFTAPTALTPEQITAFGNLLDVSYRTTENINLIIRSLEDRPGNNDFQDIFGTYLRSYTQSWYGTGETDIPEDVITTYTPGKSKSTVVTKIGAGATGTIFKGTSAVDSRKTQADGSLLQTNTNIWKAVLVKSRKDLKDVFMEAFALAVLAADPAFQQATCGILGLFRPKEFLQTLASGPIVYPEAGFTFFIKMPRYLTLEQKAKVGYSFNDMRPIIHDASLIILILLRKYKFVHSDLHVGNIMFRTNGTPVLIDFGRVGFSIGDTRYATSDYAVRDPEYPEFGWSYDMLIYVASAMRYCAQNGDFTFFSDLLKHNNIDVYNHLGWGVSPRWYLTYSFNLWTKGKATGLVGPVSATEPRVAPTWAQLEAFTDSVWSNSEEKKSIWESYWNCAGKMCITIGGILKCTCPRRKKTRKNRRQPNKRQTRRFRSHRRS